MLPETVPPAPRARRSRSYRTPPLLAIGLSLPALVAIVVVYLLPLLGTIRISFSKWSGIGALRPAGTTNYRKLLADPKFFGSLRLTLLFAFVVAFGVMLLATLTAVSVRRGRTAAFLRVVWFLPAIVPGTAMAVFWGFAFQPISGAVNGVLGRLGLGSNHTWLASPATARWAVMGVAIWAGVAFPFLIIVGAIARISPDLYEAAEIDGATGRRQLWHITLPLIQPVLVMLTVLEVIWNFNSFTLIWAMTRGGPVSSTSTLPVRLYTAAFRDFDYGQASAIGVMASIVLILAGLIGMRLANSRSAVQ